MAVTIDETVLINFKTDLARLKRELDKARTTTKKTTGLMQKEFRLSAGAVAGVTAALALLVKTGLSYNKQLESTVNGLASLNAATSSNVDSMGNHISATEKFTRAQIEAVATMRELEKINASTPHTLNQTAQIYKTMYASMKNAGVTSKEMVEITKKLSIATGAAGIEFQQVLSGVDGLANGTVLANSELGRFLNSIGLTNEKLKESTNLVKTFEDTLGDFQTADTMGVAVSNLTNAFDKFAGAVTSEAFEKVKVAINDMAEALNYVADGFERGRIQTADINTLKTVSELEERRLYTMQLLQAAEKQSNSSNSGIAKASAKGKIDLLNKEYDALTLLIAAEKKRGKLLKNNNIPTLTVYGKEIKNVSNELKRLQDILYFNDGKTSSSSNGLMSLQDILGFKDGETSPVVKAFKSGWTDVVSKTFADGIQQAFDGTYDSSKFAKNLAKTIANTSIQTGANNIASGDWNKGDWVMTIVGIATLALTSRLDKYDETHKRLADATTNLASAAKSLEEASTGRGTQIQGLMYQDNVSTLVKANKALKDFDPDFLQKFTDSGYSFDASVNLMNSVNKATGSTFDPSFGLVGWLQGTAQNATGSNQEREQLAAAAKEA